MRSGVLVLAGLVALCATGCARSAAPVGRPAVVTVAPTAAATARPEPQWRYPPGSRLARLDLDRPDAPPVVLTEDMAAAGGASVSFDGERLAFVGQARAEDPFTVWVADAEGGERRRLDAAPSGAGAVAWLPDGRLAVAAPVLGVPAPAGLSAAWALYVVTPGEAARRITFGAGELDPTVLADGRILYSQWLPGGDGRPEEGGFALFTVHPDGTGAAPLHGMHGGDPWKLQARQRVGGDIVYLAGDGDGEQVLRGVDWRRPLAGGYDIVAAQAADGTSTLRLLAPEGGGGGERMATAASAFVHAVEAAPRPRPQGHLSMVDPELAEGQLLCLDARPPGTGEASGVRIRAGETRQTAVVLGEVPLAADGSFFVSVPADRPLFLDLLSAEGRVLETTETPIWVRPKEVRGCVGCHESPLTAPPNRRPLAVLDEPIDLLPEREG